MAGIKKTVFRTGMEALYFTGAHRLLQPLLGGVGAILIETVFSWPGIGRAVYDAVLQRDYPMLQGAFLLLTISVVICNLIADLLYFKLDPRITA